MRPLSSFGNRSLAQPYDLQPLDNLPRERGEDAASSRVSSQKKRPPLRQTLERAALLALGPALPFILFGAIALAHAAAYTWVCDDAFISFRYAKLFSEGHGLVYNIGERVEGYTNFLWVIELAALHKVLGFGFAKLSLMLGTVFTVGTFVLTLALAYRGPVHAYRHFAAVLAIGWLALNRNVAVWATSGLETRQFTFFLLLAVWLAHRSTGRPERLLGASLALSGAALTRPEGPLVFGGFVLWYLLECRRARRFSLHNLSALVVPFVVIVGSHFVFRRIYYDAWLPNTYYAKHVRAWPDMGIAYYGAAFIESGAYLTLPLAFLGGLYRWMHRRDSLHLLSLCLIAPHVVYLVRIGGDHFEFRPLDFYWPLLAVATAEGLAAIALFVRLLARRFQLWQPREVSVWTGYLLALVVAVHAVALQLGQYALFYDAPFNGKHVNASLSPSTFPFAHLSPLTTRLAPLYDSSMELLLNHAIAVRHREHEEFAVAQRKRFAKYGTPGRRQLPKGATVAYPYAGIAPFQFPEVTFIDVLGLTDRTVARHNAPPNANRIMAHDRNPPPGYLESRGVNLEILPWAPTKKEALERATFAVKLAEGLWMPFESPKPAWAREAFKDYPLYERPNPKDDKH